MTVGLLKTSSFTDVAIYVSLMAWQFDYETGGQPVNLRRLAHISQERMKRLMNKGYFQLFLKV